MLRTASDGGRASSFESNSSVMSSNVQQQELPAWSPSTTLFGLPSIDESHTFTFDTTPMEDLSMDFMPAQIDMSEQSMYFNWTGAQSSTPGQPVETTRTRERLISLYYAHFHPAHPFLMPQTTYIENPSMMPSNLQRAMQVVGNQFIVAQDRHRLDLIPLDIFPDVSTVDFYSVQTLLVLALAFYGRENIPASLLAVQKASSMANELHMHEASAVSAMAGGNAVLEESLVRTWWELASMVALLSTFASSTALCTAKLRRGNLALPQEDEGYGASSLVVVKRTQSQFNDRTLFNDTHEYSSLAYKIEASRLLMAVQESGIGSMSMDRQRVLMNCLANFQLSMPVKKRESIQPDGHVDETLVQAKTIASVASILVSQLPDRRLTDTKGNKSGFVTPYDDRRSGILSKSSVRPTPMALQAADSIADAASTRSLTCTVMCHSPFYIGATELACAVHLVAYAHAEGETSRELIKERIKLSVNALTRIGENWPLAQEVSQKVLQDVKTVMSGGCSEDEDTVSMTAQNHAALDYHRPMDAWQPNNATFSIGKF